MSTNEKKVAIGKAILIGSALGLLLKLAGVKLGIAVAMFVVGFYLIATA